MHLVLLLFLSFSSLFSYSESRSIFKVYKTENKQALIIGNSDYDTFSSLKNPVNDTRAIKTFLESKGFYVFYFENGNLREMKKRLRLFSKRLKERGGVGLFYFAGHGLEVEGKNYLIPSDANIPDKDEAEYASLPVHLVIDKMENAQNRLNILILDACRNDPFSRSGAGGLAAINNAKGMYIAYSTAPGKVAKDGRGVHSPFASYLLKNMEKPYALAQLFQNVRAGVYHETNGQQLPWSSSSIIGDFYFTLPKEAKQNEKIEVSLVPKEKEKSEFSLKVKTIPSHARIRIMNIKPKYQEGMKLKKGNYLINVSANGYISKTEEYYLKSDNEVKIELSKRENIWVDPASKLIWENENKSDIYSDTQKAENYCKTLILNGYNDWRLPSVDELKSIMIKGQYKNREGRFVNSKKPLNETTGIYFHYLTGTKTETGQVWGILFSGGYATKLSPKMHSFYVRCVR